MTILFSDIRGFTSISETLDAEGLTNFMNRYLTPMTDAILQENGTVDKYIGDAIMAFWNAPLDDPEHARHACRAALVMQERLRAFNAELAQEAQATNKPFAPVVTGVGLNSAVCCVGNMGSQQRFDYSVLGDGVNLTSRLEGQTKQYGVPILIGEGTQAKVPDFATLEIDRVRVKGKREPARVFMLVGDSEVAKEPWFVELSARQAAFLGAYRSADWDRAEALLADLRAAGQGRLDRLCDRYAARISLFRISPPPADWDGVFEAEEK
jgi:adenylate cyclase